MPKSQGYYQDKEALLQKGKEQTLNHSGFTYHVIGPAERHWLSSLPDSPLPPLDAGACFGVQTIHALKSGRDVISLDKCEEHINVLRERVANLGADEGVGKLVRTVVSRLPNPDAIPDASVAGILCSEVIHFLKPGELRPLFSHFFRWLAPGGKLVVSAGAWPATIRTSVEEYGSTLPHGRSPQQVLELLKTLSPSELVDAAPGAVFVSDNGPWRHLVGDLLYQMSIEELRELSESSGFAVEELRYYNPGKYGTGNEAENVLLVAGKPVQPVL